MESLIEKRIVLNLNSVWQAIGIKTVRQAIKDMNGGEDGSTPPALAMNIEYAAKEDGTTDFESVVAMYPVPWKDWINLPVRDFDLSVSSPNMKIRVPTVIMSPNFSEMKIKQQKPTKTAIYERDGGIDQYTGKPVSRRHATVDHVIPKSKGGKDTWENLVLAEDRINFAKGDKFNEEIGYRLIRKPKAPAPIPISATIREARHIDWEHFLIKRK